MESPTEWVDSKRLAELTGVSLTTAREALRSAFEGRDTSLGPLQVIQVPGRGRGGFKYLVGIASINGVLARNAAGSQALVPYSDSTSTNLPSVPDPAAEALPSPGQFDKLLTPWKLQLVRRILAKVKAGTIARTAIIEVANSATWPTGSKKGKPLSPSTLRHWLDAYNNEGGVRGLARKERNDKGKSRVHVSRKVDAAIKKTGATEQTLREHGTQARSLALSFWAAGVNGRVDVAAACAGELVEKLRALGVPGSDAELLELATLPQRTIQRDSAKGRLLHLRKTDHAAWASSQTLRIRRSRKYKNGKPLLPGEWLAMDVHKIDVLVRRPDGSVATPYMISFLCLATNRIFCTLHLFEAGRSVRQDDVALAFAEVCSAPSVGVPKRIYTDNGPEYQALENEFMADILELSHKIEIFDRSDLYDHVARRTGLITRGRPYNPQGKIIETSFAIVERLLADTSGYIGGNRMKKKTQNQGKAPAPFPGTFEDFKAHFQTKLDYYHNKPQSGSLHGLSPNARFAELVAAHGWRAVPIDSVELAFAFSQPFERSIDRGTFKFKLPGQPTGETTLWFCKKACAFEYGTKVIVRRQPGTLRMHVFTKDANGNESHVGPAEPETYFAMDDPEGAKEGRRRNKELNQELNAFARDHITKVTPIESLKKFNAAKPPLVIPEPHPAISAGPQFQAAALACAPAQLEQSERAAERRAREDSALAKLTAPFLRLRYDD